eukprot:m.309836 g.309836  ORF g.309836 m.309836 type:complete len:590 (-) comp19645_c1_seq2:1706-3475(-)
MAKAVEPNLGAPQLAVRSADGVQVVQPGKSSSPPVPALSAEKSPNCKVMAFSEDGSLFAWCNGTEVIVVNAASGDVKCSIPRPRTIELCFSPLNTFLACWEVYAVRKGETPAPGTSDNLTVWSLNDGSRAMGWIAKRNENWVPRWTDDEELCARCVNNEIQFYDGHDFSKGITNRLRIPGVSMFKLSPKSNPTMIAAFVPGSKGAPAAVRLFRGPNFDTPLCNKSFFKADKVTITWNQQGTAVLVSAQTEVDKTGKSYYGETNLYYLKADGLSYTVQLDKQGPIYDFDWSPNGREFGVVYGFMPSKAMLFDHNCKKIYDFGTGPRSVFKHSPHGNVICIAGFGNLRGNVEFWGRQNLKLLNTIQAPDTTQFAWAPDSRHFVTATTSPRLKVDNGYKVWHYTQGLVCSADFRELWATQWQPAAPDSYPERPLSPLPAGAPAGGQLKKAAVYRPPGLRGTQSKLKLHDEDQPAEGTAPPTKQSKSALRNKKKREAKRAAESGAVPDKKKSAEQQQALATAKAVLAPAAASGGGADVEKRIRNLNKKLRQINDLKAKQASGEELQPNQAEKVKTETAVLAEIASLEKQLAAL